MSRKILLVTMSAAAAACSPLPTAEPRPAAEPLAELWREPAVSTELFESHPALDPRTGDLYFVRSSRQFTGWVIYLSRCVAGSWQTAEKAWFSTSVDADPYFARSGSRLYFISRRPDPPAKLSKDLDIWYMDRARDGRWSRPVRMPAPVNSPGQEWFPRQIRSGQLYFGSSRSGGLGKTDLYKAELRNGRWAVSNLGADVNTPGDDYEFEPASTGRFAIAMTDGELFRVERKGTGWTKRGKIDIGPGDFAVGPTLSPKGRSLMFAREAPQQSGELWRYRLGAPEAWPECRGGS